MITRLPFPAGYKQASVTGKTLAADVQVEDARNEATEEGAK